MLQETSHSSVLRSHQQEDESFHPTVWIFNYPTNSYYSTLFSMSDGQVTFNFKRNSARKKKKNCSESTAPCDYSVPFLFWGAVTTVLSRIVGHWILGPQNKYCLWWVHFCVWVASYPSSLWLMGIWPSYWHLFIVTHSHEDMSKSIFFPIKRKNWLPWDYDSFTLSWAFFRATEKRMTWQSVK